MSKQSCVCSTAKPTTQKQKTKTKIQPATWSTGNSELKDHILARLGMNRQNHTVTPGIYSLGNPNPYSPVFVTANYTLSFDALRSSLQNQALEKINAQAKIEVVTATEVYYGKKVGDSSKLRPLFDKYGMDALPALFVNEELALYGGLPSIEKLTEIIQKALNPSQNRI